MAGPRWLVVLLLSSVCSGAPRRFSNWQPNRATEDALSSHRLEGRPFLRDFITSRSFDDSDHEHHRHPGTRSPIDIESARETMKTVEDSVFPLSEENVVDMLNELIEAPEDVKKELVEQTSKEIKKHLKMSPTDTIQVETSSENQATRLSGEEDLSDEGPRSNLQQSIVQIIKLKRVNEKDSSEEEDSDVRGIKIKKLKQKMSERGSKAFSRRRGGAAKQIGGFRYSVRNRQSERVYGHEALYGQKDQRGSYFVHFSDGRILYVSYTADHLGYRPIIRYFNGREELDDFLANQSPGDQLFPPRVTTRTPSSVTSSQGLPSTSPTEVSSPSQPTEASTSSPPTEVSPSSPPSEVSSSSPPTEVSSFTPPIEASSPSPPNDVSSMPESPGGSSLPEQPLAIDSTSDESSVVLTSDEDVVSNSFPTSAPTHGTTLTEVKEPISPSATTQEAFITPAPEEETQVTTIVPNVDGNSVSSEAPTTDFPDFLLTTSPGLETLIPELDLTTKSPAEESIDNLPEEGTMFEDSTVATLPEVLNEETLETNIPDESINTVNPEMESTNTSKPEEDSIVSIEPEEGSVVTIEPEEDSVVSIEPEEDSVINSKPEEDNIDISNPDEDSVVTFEPEEDSVVNFEPEEDSVVTFEPVEDSVVTFEPEDDSLVNFEPVEDSVVTFEPEGDSVVSFEPEEDSVVNFEPVEDSVVTFEPEDDSVVNFEPEEDSVLNSETEEDYIETSNPEEDYLVINEPEEDPVVTNEPEVEENPTVTSQPEEDSLLTNEPDVSLSSKPEEVSIITTEPEEDHLVTSKPEAESLATSAPEESPVTNEPEESPVVTNEPEESPVVTNEPQEDSLVTIKPEEESMVTTESEESPLVTSRPDKDSTVTIRPEEDFLLSNEPEEDSLVTSRPEEELLVPNIVEEESATTTEYEDSLVTTAPETEHVGTIAPEDEPLLTSEPEHESTVTKVPEEEFLAINEPEGNHLTTIMPNEESITSEFLDTATLNTDYSVTTSSEDTFMTGFPYEETMTTNFPDETMSTNFPEEIMTTNFPDEETMTTYEESLVTDTSDVESVITEQPNEVSPDSSFLGEDSPVTSIPVEEITTSVQVDNGIESEDNKETEAPAELLTSPTTELNDITVISSDSVDELNGSNYEMEMEEDAEFFTENAEPTTESSHTFEKMVMMPVEESGDTQTASMESQQEDDAFVEVESSQEMDVNNDGNTDEDTNMATSFHDAGEIAVVNDTHETISSSSAGETQDTGDTQIMHPPLSEVEEESSLVVEEENVKPGGNIINILPPPSPSQKALYMELLPKNVTQLYVPPPTMSSNEPVTPIIPHGDTKPEYVAISVLQQKKSTVDAKPVNTEDERLIRPQGSLVEELTKGLTTPSPARRTPTLHHLTLGSTSQTLVRKPVNRNRNHSSLRNSPLFANRTPSEFARRLRPALKSSRQRQTEDKDSSTRESSADRAKLFQRRITSRRRFPSTRNARLYQHWLNRQSRRSRIS